MRFLILFFVTSICSAQTNLEAAENYFQSKQYSKAEELFKKELSMHPNDAKLIEYLGDSYGYQGKWEDAKKQYKKLVRINPNSATYNYKYGGTLALISKESSSITALGMIGKVTKHLKKAAVLDPNHVEARWALVEVYIQIPYLLGGGKKKALRYAKELENISLIDGYLAKAYVEEYKGDAKKAENYHKKAIELDKKNDAVEKNYRNALYYQLGKIAAEYNIELERGEKALITYIQNHSVQDGVPVEWAYYRLAQIYKHKGLQREALIWIDKALIAKSDFKQALQEKRNITTTP